MNNYNELMNAFKEDDEQSKLDRIYKYVNEIPTENKEFVLEALICKIEAENNNSSYYASMAIVYSIVAVTVTLMLDQFKTNPTPIAAFIALIIIVLLVHTISERKRAKSRTFILTALRFKYDELRNSPPKNHNSIT